jgi:hypothetical protein
MFPSALERKQHWNYSGRLRHLANALILRSRKIEATHHSLWLLNSAAICLDFWQCWLFKFEIMLLETNFEANVEALLELFIHMINFSSNIFQSSLTFGNGQARSWRQLNVAVCFGHCRLHVSPLVPTFFLVTSVTFCPVVRYSFLNGQVASVLW